MNNSVTLAGYVGNEPVEVTFQSGRRVTQFSLGVKEFSSNGKDKTMWVQVKAWNGNGDRVHNLITKGREIVVMGRLSMESYSKQLEDGTTEKITKPVVTLSSFYLCGKKPGAKPTKVTELETEVTEVTREVMTA
ncbi:MAG: single-stranded DNA-binding protein [Candidatus Obscuribacterales bacterium]|nr:single-stranded DNA-binding protein [Candidatus Obscuribacterales bacterium]